MTDLWAGSRVPSDKEVIGWLRFRGWRGDCCDWFDPETFNVVDIFEAVRLQRERDKCTSQDIVTPGTSKTA